MNNSMERLANNPLIKTIFEMNKELEILNTSRIEVNIISGFALLVSILDKDVNIPQYLSDLKEISIKVADKFSEPGDWFNIDLLLTGTTLDELEYTTGYLSFRQAFELSKIRVNVIETKDLLRLKLSLLDKALAELEFEGSFNSYKDLDEIIAIIDKFGYNKNTLNEEFGKDIFNENLIDVIYLYKEKGREAFEEELNQIQEENYHSQIVFENEVDKGEKQEKYTEPFKRPSKQYTVIDNIIAADGNSSASLVDIDGDGTPDYIVIHNNDDEEIADVRDCEPEAEIKKKNVSHDEYER